MAVTIITTPVSHYPAFNDQWFLASSSQTAQPNFQFYIVVTVYYHNGTSYTTKSYIEPVNNPTDSILRFNARTYGENFIKHYVPITDNTADFRVCTNGILKIDVNIGERYGTTPAIYSGATQTYYVWNASLSFLEVPLYSTSTYLANNGAAFPILNNYPDTRVTANSQNFLYILCASDNVISKAKIINTDGASVVNFDITNSKLNSGNWYDRYLCLRVDPQFLASVGGANWIATVGETYSVVLYDNTNTIQKQVDFVYDSFCKYYPYQQIYLNPKGAYDFFNFELVSEEDYSITKTQVKTTPYTNTGTTQTYGVSSGENKTTTVRFDQSIKLNSNWITQEQSETLKELVTSPVVYLQDLKTTYLKVWSINPSDTKYKRNRNFNGKLFNLISQIDMAHSNYRQKGV